MICFRLSQTIYLWEWRSRKSLASSNITTKVCALSFAPSLSLDSPTDAGFFVTVGVRLVRFWKVFFENSVHIYLLSTFGNS